MSSNETSNIYASEYSASSRPIPADSADGTYVFKATAADGVITYEWVAEV